MASSSEPLGLVQPLSVGNVVSAGLRLYSNHFKQYFRIALIATLWILLPFLLLIPIIGFFVTVQNYYAILALLVPAWIVLFLYCSVRYLAGAAAIARLAFGELTNQPETSREALRFARSRMWGFWLISFLLSLIYGGIAVGFYIFLIILFIACFATLGGAALFQSADPSAVFTQLASNPAPLIVMILGFLVLLFVFLLLLTWFNARFAVAELPLAVETQGDAIKSIGRSWMLTSKSVWRIVLILFITFLITVPLQFLVQFVSGILQLVLATVIPPDSSSYGILSLLVSYIVGFISSIFVIPLWQAMKAVIYYDLRSRREGMGLELRDSPTDPFQSPNF
jgi:hypothetical protein